MVGLGYLPGGDLSEAIAVNGDGSVVVGYSTGDDAGAFRWTAASGRQTVSDWLADSGVAVAEGFTIREVRDVSDDGNVLIGTGTDVRGDPEPWIARGGSGVLTLDDDLTQSLTSSGQGMAQVKQQMDLMLNGAHHRPLMDSAMPGHASCGWISGDLAHYGHDRDADSALGEVGFCNRLRRNELMVGLGLGKNYTDEETAFSGDIDINGQYLLGEVDYRPAGSSLLYSFTAMVGSWDADIKRGYLNAGVEDSSNGSSDIEGASLRARVDWLNAWRMGDTNLTPRVQYALTRTRMDGYTETGGGFPVRFDARDHTAQELRLGVRSDHVLNGTTTLHGDVEAVHRFDDSNAGTSGQVVGLFGFDLPGTDVNQDWLRVGVEMDHRLGKNRTISASLHVSSAGEDPSYSAGVSLKFGLD